VVEAQRGNIEQHLRLRSSADVDSILQRSEVSSLGTNSGC
jgi:hypothetical protein